MEYKKRYSFYRNLLAAPFIFSVLVPLVFLDLVMEIFHRISFPLYRIPYVQRSEYIKFDRHKLTYLKWWEKIGCTYCGYANGLLRYCAVIAARTEKYWCSIKHQPDAKFTLPKYQSDFIEFGDKKTYMELEENYQKLQKENKHHD